MTRVTLYYDIVSPYAYIAFETWQRYLKLWQITDFQLRPIYLGGVMAVSGNKPPMTVAAKGAWMGKDLKRVSEYWKVHVVPPSPVNGMPPNTIHTIRFLRQLQDDKPEALTASTRAFYEANFGQNKTDITKPGNFASILEGVEGLDSSTIDAITQASTSSVNKERLKSEATQLVNEQGAFGFPWVHVQREDGEEATFFGADRFEMIGHFISKPWYGPDPNGSRPAPKL